MKEKRFIDTIDITLVAGNGGSGAVSFHREKYKPRGKPDGGDGGSGGNVILETNDNLSDLSKYSGINIIRAGHGRRGGRNNKRGKSGKNRIINLPPGTVVYNKETDKLITDMDKPGIQFVLARGGRGGKGNSNFKSSVNRAPDKFGPGMEGETKAVRFELKIIADVGLVGLPNAGKSTLLNALTDAKSRVANYPFTTLNPNIGVIQDNEVIFKTGKLVIGDIPGIISGASKGIGLGLKFLRHIERTNILLIVLSLESENVLNDYDTIMKELYNYNSEIVKKKKIIVCNKSDINYNQENLKKLKRNMKEKIYIISALKKEGLNEVKTALLEMM